MFVGHYAASLALKKYNKDISLGWLFIGAQLVDIFFFSFVLLGIERLNIIEHYTASNHFHLEFMPYTHSLLSTFIWGILGYGIGTALWKGKKKIASAFALAIISHWFFDLPVHTPDLPIWNDESLKLGFGLWNHKNLAFMLECTVLLVGLFFYWKATRPQSKTKRYGIIAFVIFMLAFHASQVYGEPVPAFMQKTSLSISAIASYFIFAWIAHWIDQKP